VEAAFASRDLTDQAGLAGLGHGVDEVLSVMKLCQVGIYNNKIVSHVIIT
jgi:hypothetical protein